MNTPPAPDNDDDLQALLRDSAGLQDAPEHVILRAAALWSPPPAAAPTLPQRLRRLLAQLSFDSGGASGLALGLRGDESAARQWLFTCDAHDVDLRCEPDEGPAGGEAWLLSGQVLGPEAPGELWLYEGEAQAEPLRRVALGELSDFRCEGLAPATYRLVFLIGELDIELPPIVLGPPPPAV